MATPKIKVAPERIAQGKHLYELTTTPVPDIAAMLGMSHRTLGRRLDEWGWARRSPPRIATDRAHVAATPAGTIADAPVPATREAVVERILSAINSELDAIHRVLAKVDPADKGEAERCARTLAGTARALQDLMAAAKAEKVAPPDETDPDNVPRGLDELRDALAQRIEAFVAARRGRTGPAPEGDAGAGNQAL